MVLSLLYVGDHMFGDVRVTKDILRWRTSLILRDYSWQFYMDLENLRRNLETEGPFHRVVAVKGCALLFR